MTPTPKFLTIKIVGQNKNGGITTWSTSIPNNPPVSINDAETLKMIAQDIIDDKIEDKKWKKIISAHCIIGINNTKIKLT